MNVRDAKTLLLASQPSTSQPKASPASPLPGSHVIAVPGWVDHDLLHTHRLLRAVVLVQVVFSSHHTEGHLTAVTEEKTLRDPGGSFPSEKSWETISRPVFKTGSHFSSPDRGRTKDPGRRASTKLSPSLIY